MSKLAKFRKKHRDRSEPKRNPPIGTDVLEYILPATAAFATARLVTRVATTQISKRFPKVAKHAGALAAAGSFGAAWLGAHRVSYLEPYHHPIVVGAGLAAVQSLVQLYLPKFGWILGDPNPEQAKAQQTSLPLSQAQQQFAAPPVVVPDGFQETSAAEWHAYNDAFDAGGYKGKPQAQQVQPQQPPPPPADDVVTDVLDNSDLNLGNEDMGLFS